MRRAREGSGLGSEPAGRIGLWEPGRMMNLARGFGAFELIEASRHSTTNIILMTAVVYPLLPLTCSSSRTTCTLPGHTLFRMQNREDLYACHGGPACIGFLSLASILHPSCMEVALCQARHRGRLSFLSRTVQGVKKGSLPRWHLIS